MTENKQLTEYIKKVFNPPDNVELFVYDEDNNEKDLSNGIVNVWVKAETPDELAQGLPKVPENAL